METDPVQLSWVLPLYRTAEFLTELIQRIEVTTSSLGLEVTWEVVLVDDACPAGSGAVADRIASADSRVVVEHIRSNVGQDSALRTGIRRARGNWVVILDADLQDPPEALSDLWRKRRGQRVVFADRRGRYTSRLRHLTSWVYRQLMRWLVGLPRGAGLYALMDRRTASEIAATSHEPFALLATFAALGGPMVSVTVQRQPRRQGRSAYTSRMRLAKGLRNLFHSFSKARKDRSLCPNPK